MVVRKYEFTLYRSGKEVRDVPAFTRAADLDDDKFHSETDGLILKWLVAAVRRAGADPRRDLDEFELHIRLPGEWKVIEVFSASRDEVDDQ